MRKTMAVFSYYFTSITILKWMVWVGLVCVLLQGVVSEPRYILLLSLAGYGLTLVIPVLIAPSLFRKLISNRRLSLLPGFHVSAGLALLLLTSLASLYIPVVSAIFGDGVDSIPFILSVGIFIGVSVYIGQAQLLATSKYGMFVSGLMVPACMVLYNIYEEELRAILSDPVVIISLFAVTIAGWGYGLFVLFSRTRFKPPAYNIHLAGTSSGLQQGWTSGSGGGFFIGSKGTPSGTLLLRYPDGSLGIAGQAFVQIVLIPVVLVLFFTILIYLLGAEQKSAFTMLEGFLLLSLYCSAFNTIGCAELVARARLIWLRYHGDRSMLWQFLESLYMQRLGLLYLWAFLVGALCAIYTEVSLTNLTHYFLIVVSITFGNLYISTLFRLRGWHEIILGLLLVPVMFILMFALLRGYVQGEYNYIIAIESVYVILGLLARYVAKQTFEGIDWCKIKPVLKDLRIATE